MQTKQILILYLQCNMIVSVEKAYFIDTLDCLLHKAKMIYGDNTGIMNIETMQRAIIQRSYWRRRKDKDLQKTNWYHKNNLKIQLDNKRIFLKVKSLSGNKIKEIKSKDCRSRSRTYNFNL